MTLANLFPDSAPIQPSAPEEQRADFAHIPAKPAVYLLADQGEAGDDRPLLLATVGDLRAALKRRLADMPSDAPTKRVAYGQICTRVFWRQVNSSFAANFWYARSARALFPETAEGLIPWRNSWWVAVERAGSAEHLQVPHPRFRKTNNLGDPSLTYVGPVRDKHAAQRLVESLEDLFDLCRYHQILVQAPHGKPCAYKEMGKCPAPCDGTVPLDVYHRQIAAALGFATNETRQQWKEDLEAKMRAAAGRLEFETAGRLKQRLQRAGLLDSDAFSILAPLEHFAFLTLQPGKGKPWIEPWVLHPGAGVAECLPQFHKKNLAAAAGSLAERCHELLQRPAVATFSREQSELAALVAHHLFRGENDHGIWLRLSDLRDQETASTRITQACEALLARKASKPVAEQSSDHIPATEEAPGEPAHTLDIAVAAAGDSENAAPSA